MQLYYIRHAQSYNNALWFQTGSDSGRSEDPELTEVGYRQAQLLAEFLSENTPKAFSPDGGEGQGTAITHLYTSLMVRSVMTATILAEKLGLPLVAWEELHERGGIYLREKESGEIECLPGKNRAYFGENFPGLVLPDEFPEAGWWNFRPHETPDICLQRARRFLDGLLERHGGSQDRVAVVSHGGFYNDFLRVLLGLAEREGIWFSLYNTAITRIDFHSDLVELVYQNRVDHLPRELIT